MSVSSQNATLWQAGNAKPRVLRQFSIPLNDHTVAAFGLIALSTVLHFLYLLNCPFELAPDEAHYWDWSRHLDWSYYSKGPLVAWLIRLSCELFGGISEHFVRSPMLAIRLPAIVFNSLSLLAAYVLLRRLTGSGRLALSGLATMLTFPFIVAGGTLMTIDAPFLCLWAWALVLTWDALIGDRKWAWPIVGALVGLGILAKYTMVLFPAGVFLMMLTTCYRRELTKPGPWLAVSIAGLCCLPILIWNMQHDWITFRHVGAQAGTSSAGIRWFGPVKFLLEQAGVMLIVWFIAYVGTLWSYRPGKCRDARRLLLWWTSAPVFGLFLLTSFKSSGQANWVMAAYVSGLVLTFDWIAARLKPDSGSSRFHWRRSIIVAGICGFVLTTCVHFPQTLRRPLAWLADLSAKSGPCPIRKLDPTVRLRGWKHLAAEVDRIRADLIAQGDEPLIATTFWNLSGEIGFYCHDHPEIYSFGAALGQRMSQYDLWRPNPLWEADEFRNRTFIVVGDYSPQLGDAFESIEMSKRLWYREGPDPICYWQINIAKGYKGFGPPSQWVGGMKY